MKGKLLNTFFLVFAAVLIAVTTESVATNGPRQSEVGCKDFLGLEKIFGQAKTENDEVISLNVKVKCSDDDLRTMKKNY